MTTTKNVYTVIEGMREREGKPVFVKIGTATVNPDGSMSVKLNALPVNGKLEIRPQP